MPTLSSEAKATIPGLVVEEMERIIQFAEVSGDRFLFKHCFAGTVHPHLHFLYIGEFDVGRDLIQCESAGIHQLLEPFRAVADARDVVDTVLGHVRAGVAKRAAVA
jgi:hypothetical protein